MMVSCSDDVNDCDDDDATVEDRVTFTVKIHPSSTVTHHYCPGGSTHGWPLDALGHTSDSRTCCEIVSQNEPRVHPCGRGEHHGGGRPCDRRPGADGCDALGAHVHGGRAPYPGRHPCTRARALSGRGMATKAKNRWHRGLIDCIFCYPQLPIYIGNRQGTLTWIQEPPRPSRRHRNHS